MMKTVFAVALACAFIAAAAVAGYDETLGPGNVFGNMYGPPAAADCPTSPEGLNNAATALMDQPPPLEADGPPARVYFGNKVARQVKSKALCDWLAERANKQLELQDRCWPNVNGKPNHISTIKWNCL